MSIEWRLGFSLDDLAMNIIEIMKAYEIFRYHGHDISNLVYKSLQLENNIVDVEKQRNILSGDT